jgi:hypothetical protein
MEKVYRLGFLPNLVRWGTYRGGMIIITLQDMLF